MVHVRNGMENLRLHRWNLEPRQLPIHNLYEWDTCIQRLWCKIFAVKLGADKDLLFSFEEKKNVDNRRKQAVKGICQINSSCCLWRVASSSPRYPREPTASPRRSAAASSSRSWRGSTIFTSAASYTSISSPRQALPHRFKGTVLRDKFRKCWRILVDLGLNKGRGWVLNFSEAPLIFN